MNPASFPGSPAFCILMFYYMHNNTNYHGWNKALTFGVGSIQLSFRTIVFTQYMQRYFQSKCYCISVKLCRGLHFSAFYILYFLEYNTAPPIIATLVAMVSFRGNTSSIHYLPCLFTMLISVNNFNLITFTIVVILL